LVVAATDAFVRWLPLLATSPSSPSWRSLPRGAVPAFSSARPRRPEAAVDAPEKALVATTTAVPTDAANPNSVTEVKRGIFKYLPPLIFMLILIICFIKKLNIILFITQSSLNIHLICLHNFNFYNKTNGQS
jgi:hypothetical protein